jgi:UDP-3-O-[3-hydroxymyristoyl] glucosamine N-acyltransferase
MKLKELAQRLKLQLRGDGEVEISGPAPIDVAGPGNVTFVGHPRYVAWLERSSASCVITTPDLADKVKGSVILSANPHLDFARTLEIFFPPYRPSAGIARNADIAADATLGEGCSVGAFAVIQAGVTIGKRAVLHPHVTIYPGARIGDDFVCHSHVSIRENVIIGNRVTIHNGAVIGSDGFGFVPNDGALAKTPQVGTVIVEDDVEIGANATIDRATIGATLIHRAVKLDNLVQIGHNCEIGSYSRFAAQVGIAGSVKVGEWCEFGGQTGCADNIRIGDRVRAAGKSGIPGNVESGTTVSGSPALEIGKWRRASVIAARLPEMSRRLRALEDHCGIAPRSHRLKPAPP